MTKVYTNVVALALISATVASILFKILETAGAASIIVPLGIGLTVGFLQIALVMARRQKVFKGPFAPGQYSMQSACSLRRGLSCLSHSEWALQPSERPSSMPLTRQSIANTMLLGALAPIVAGVVGVIMAFASREEDGEDDAPKAVTEDSFQALTNYIVTNLPQRNAENEQKND